MVRGVVEAADSAAALARIREVRAEFVAGAKCEDVARRESQDPVSAAKGGDLGEWTRGQMVAEFDSMAFKLPVGKLSEPFLSPFGYHIMEVTGRTGTKVKGRHILVSIDLAGSHRDKVDAIAD